MADFMRKSKPSFTVLATNEIMPIVEKAQMEMIEEFVQHPVTQEINAGPTASNTSGTLGGVGNLFAFLGFDISDNPTLDILEILYKTPRVSKVKTSPNGKFVIYLRDMPNAPEIFAATPLTWANSKSWAEGIESGIAGFGRFMYDGDKGFPSPKPSHSGHGIQIKGLLRGGKFENTKYISSIINNFTKKIK